MMLFRQIFASLRIASLLFVEDNPSMSLAHILLFIGLVWGSLGAESAGMFLLNYKGFNILIHKFFNFVCKMRRGYIRTTVHSVS